MPAVDFITEFNEKVLKDTDLDQWFAVLANHVNGPLIRADDVRPECVNTRHVSQALRPSFCVREEAPTLRATSYGGWYLIENAVINVESVVPNTSNHDGKSAPVNLVEAILYLDDGVNTFSPTQVALGHSTDGGTTWNADTETRRPVAAGSGGTKRYFDLSLQQSFWGGTSAGYIPFNIPADGYMKLIGGYGGPKSLADPSTITHYGIMVNANSLGAESRPRLLLSLYSRSIS